MNVDRHLFRVRALAAYHRKQQQMALLAQKVASSTPTDTPSPPPVSRANQRTDISSSVGIPAHWANDVVGLPKPDPAPGSTVSEKVEQEHRPDRRLRTKADWDTLSLAVPKEEKKRLKLSAEASGKRFSEWAREILLRHAR